MLTLCEILSPLGPLAGIAPSPIPVACELGLAPDPSTADAVP